MSTCFDIRPGEVFPSARRKRLDEGLESRMNRRVGAWRIFFPNQSKIDLELARS